MFFFPLYHDKQCNAMQTIYIVRKRRIQTVISIIIQKTTTKNKDKKPPFTDFRQISTIIYIHGVYSTIFDSTQKNILFKGYSVISDSMSKRIALLFVISIRFYTKEHLILDS